MRIVWIAAHLEHLEHLEQLVDTVAIYCPSIRSTVANTSESANYTVQRFC